MVAAREFDSRHGGAGEDHGEEEFGFEDSDEVLPWLEGDDSDQPAGFDTTRLVGLALVLVAVLGAVVGGIWWLSNGATAGGPDPDGSVVAAPEGEYKVRPAEEGGKTFAGTGDTSFAVGEGQTRESRLADRGAAPEPMAPSVDTPTSPGTDAPPPPPRSQALPAGTAVQVGAYSNRADAEAGWATVTRQTDILSGVDYRIVEGRADIGTVYRLQAVGGDPANARRLCRALAAAGLQCTVK